MTNQDNNFEQLEKDIMDIILYPQLPPGSVQTRDVRGHTFSSTELSYKIDLLMERVKAHQSSLEEAVRLARIDELRGVTKITGKYASKAKALDEVWNRCMKRLATLNKDQEKQ